MKFVSTALWGHSPWPVAQTVRPNVRLADIQTVQTLRVMNAWLESMDLLAQQPVPAPVTALLVAIRQQVISLDRLRRIVLLARLESIST